MARFWIGADIVHMIVFNYTQACVFTVVQSHSRTAKLIHVVMMDPCSHNADVDARGKQAMDGVIVYDDERGTRIRELMRIRGRSVEQGYDRADPTNIRAG